MADSEAPQQKAWSIMRHCISWHGWWWGTTPAGTADSETPYQQIWQIEKHNTSRHAGFSYKRSAWWLSGNGLASIHLAAAQGSVHVCSTCTIPAAQQSFPQGQQTYLPLSMFDNVAQGQCKYLKPSSFVLLQLHETSRPVAASMSLKCALKQQAFVLQLHLTTWHVGYNYTLQACMSVRVASH